MAWIKRNLFFVIGSFIALVLMGVGAWMLVAQMGAESKVSEEIAKQYDDLKRLNQQNPHPGDANIDNIKNAKEQEAAIRAYVAKVRPFFQRIPSIPDASSAKISDATFAAELRNTVSSLTNEAEKLSVTLPPDYYFTFQSQRKIMIFDPGSLEKLAVQLGEIKTLSEILFDAKINSLDGIRRESVSTNDNNAPDYLPRKTRVTPLADISPYEITFRCFSTELSLVLSHLASSPNGFIVKGVNVEPTGTVSEESNGGMPGSPNMPAPGAPPYRGDRRFVPPGMAPAAPAAAAAVSRNGQQTFLTEKLFRVTLFIDVVKLKPAATK